MERAFSKKLVKWRRLLIQKHTHLKIFIKHRIELKTESPLAWKAAKGPRRGGVRCGNTDFWSLFILIFLCSPSTPFLFTVSAHQSVSVPPKEPSLRPLAAYLLPILTGTFGSFSCLTSEDLVPPFGNYSPWSMESLFRFPSIPLTQLLSVHYGSFLTSLPLMPAFPLILSQLLFSSHCPWSTTPLPLMLSTCILVTPQSDISSPNSLPAF